MNSRPSLIAQLGDVMQMAFVPRNFDASLRFWTETMGVGPFFLHEHAGVKDVLYRGQPSDVDFGVAIAYWGDLQIELILQHNDAPSIYKEWRDAGREGLPHVCVVVDDMAEPQAVCRQLGAVVLQEGRLEGGEVIYVDPGGGAETIVEIIKLPQASLDGFAFMRESARGWDGSGPVRRLG